MKLYELRLKERGSFADHLDEFNRLRTELKAIDAKIPKEDKSIVLLVSLPSSYEHPRTTLMYGKDTLGFDEVVASLLSHETLRRKENDEASEERVMVASNSGEARGRSME